MLFALLTSNNKLFYKVGSAILKERKLKALQLHHGTSNNIAVPSLHVPTNHHLQLNWYLSFYTVQFQERNYVHHSICHRQAM